MSVLGHLLLNQLVRFDAVHALVEECEGGSLLDVGSGSRGIGAMLGPPWRVTAVDSSFDDYGAAAGPRNDHVERIIADARELPFADRAFDVVVALDVVEHIRPADRAAAIGEICRVASRRVVIACPTGSPALEADRELARFEATRGGVSGWLEEHLQNGFPSKAEIVEALAAASRELGDGRSPRTTENENVGTHLRLMHMEATRWGSRLSRASARLLAARGLGRLGSGWRAALLRRIRGGDGPPAYRTIAVLDLNGR